MKTFKFSLVLSAHENTDVFITLDENIYVIHSKQINILYALGQIGLCKQSRFRSDTTECSVWSMSTLSITYSYILDTQKGSRMDTFKL